MEGGLPCFEGMKRGDEKCNDQRCALSCNLHFYFLFFKIFFSYSYSKQGSKISHF